MKRFATILLSLVFIFSSSLQAAPAKKNKLSPEAKGVISGGTVAGIGTTIGITVAGITALFPAVLVGTGLGYITVKAGKGIKKLRKNNKK